MMLKGLLVAAAVTLAAGTASAATVTVDAVKHSSNLGSGLATNFFLTAGQSYSVTAGLGDTWSLGSNIPCSRETNANGIAPDPNCYPLYTQGNLTANYGSLVGQIGLGGDFFVLGTSFLGAAAATGQLFLYNWDNPETDNSGSIEVTVSAVPLPASGILLLGALAGIAGLTRRRKNMTA